MVVKSDTFRVTKIRLFEIAIEAINKSNLSFKGCPYSKLFSGKKEPEKENSYDAICF